MIANSAAGCTLTVQGDDHQQCSGMHTSSTADTHWWSCGVRTRRAPAAQMHARGTEDVHQNCRRPSGSAHASGRTACTLRRRPEPMPSPAAGLRSLCDCWSTAFPSPYPCPSLINPCMGSLSSAVYFSGHPSCPRMCAHPLVHPSSYTISLQSPKQWTS